MEEIIKFRKRIRNQEKIFREHEEFSKQVTPWNLDLFLEFLEAIPEKLAEVDEKTVTNAARAYNFLSCIEGELSPQLHNELHRYFHECQNRNHNLYLASLYFSSQ